MQNMENQGSKLTFNRWMFTNLLYFSVLYRRQTGLFGNFKNFRFFLYKYFLT